MIITLAGQPNCGKSSIFNAIAGYKATTANFPGQTVTYLRSKVMVDDNVIEILDLPGTYSLSSTDLAEREALRFLLRRETNVVVNVLDASILSRSLELTLQLLEMDIPMVICLNMMDDARRKGISIDTKALEKLLGVPVVTTVATSGEGISELLETALKQARQGGAGIIPQYSKDVEKVIESLTDVLDPDRFALPNLKSRFIAIKLLEGDPDFVTLATQIDPSLKKKIKKGEDDLRLCHGRDPDTVISSERHSLAMNIFEEVANVGTPARERLSDRLDAFLIHPWWGFVILIAIFYAVFWAVFSVGGTLEEPVFRFFNSLSGQIKAAIPNLFLFSVVNGAVRGIAGGVAIVLPYLTPFFLLLSLLEDSGYLPRMAFLTDSTMHRLGLHGKSTFPLMIGYGCAVPAVMGTRILESSRDRFVTSALAVMIPCSAKISIIFGLVAAFLSPTLALSVFLINLAILAIVGKILAIYLPDEAPGLILEIPPYRLPRAKMLFVKTWIRLREFLSFAWPILILGSALFELMIYLNLEGPINSLARPVTWTLGLPAAVGVPLVFGIFRKELSLIMLFQALGTTQITQVLSPVQIMTFTLFVVFYIPCLSTISVLLKEQRLFNTIKIIGLTIVVSLLVGLAVRFVGTALSF